MSDYNFRLAQLAWQVDGYTNPRFEDSLTYALHEILTRDQEDILECAYPEGEDGDYYPEDEDDAAEYIREGILENWLDDLVCMLTDREILVYDDDGLPLIKWVGDKA